MDRKAHSSQHVEPPCLAAVHGVLAGAGRAVSMILLIALLAGCTLRFDVQGHRGARGLAPENTLLAFERALQLGVNTLELDIGVTQDGAVVVYHDRALNPDTTRDASGAFLSERGPAVSSLTYAQLLQYDVGKLRRDSTYGKPFVRQEAQDGLRVPLLADVFELARLVGPSGTRFNIETKLSPLAPTETVSPEVMVRALIKEIRRERMAPYVTIQSFDWRTLAIAQREAPEIETVYLSNEQGAGDTLQRGKPGASPWLAGHDIDDYKGSVPALIRAAGGRIWSPNFRDLSADAVREAHSLKIKVIPWTVNERADMLRLMEWGVDGLITDYPDVLLALRQ
jgi:glycerophosphoryl diester phosphodiesterase